MEIRQEMPPPGGYAPITYKKVPLKPGISIFLKLGALMGISAAGWYGHYYFKKIRILESIESRCVRVALSPMLLAEADRMLLKQLKRNRDAEERIMKDVKGWEVGKWKGLPVFNSVDPNEFYLPAIEEYYVHTDTDYSDISTMVYYYT